MCQSRSCKCPHSFDISSADSDRNSAILRNMRTFSVIGLALFFSASALADPAQEARAIIDELVAVDTTNPPGKEAAAARAVQKRLAAAGIKAELVEFAPGRAN